MTNKDVAKMKADPELDAVVAERVFEWKWWRYLTGQYLSGSRRGDYQEIVVRSIQPPGFPENREAWQRWMDEAGWAPADGTEPEHQYAGHSDLSFIGKVPAFSTDIAEAWRLVMSYGVGWQFATIVEGRQCAFVRLHQPSRYMSKTDVYEDRAEKDQMPLAICRAALKSIVAQDADDNSSAPQSK